MYYIHRNHSEKCQGPMKKNISKIKNNKQAQDIYICMYLEIT